MGLSLFLGRDGLLHPFTYIPVHTARIYDAPTPQTKRGLGRRAIARHQAPAASQAA